MNNTLLITLIFLSSPIFGSEKKQNILSTLEKKVSTATHLASKYIILACEIALAPHSVFEFISVYAHEHGHGLASGGNYKVKMIKNDGIINPWGGKCSCTQEGAYPLFTKLAGPATGVFITCIQSISLNITKEYLENKSFSTSFNKSLYFPITFFPNAINTGLTYGSMLINTQSINLLSSNPLITLHINIILFSRMGRIIAESIYGFLPYDCEYENTPGDGEEIWKMIFGKKCPTFKGNLVYITLTILLIPYIIGIALAFAQA